MASCLLAMTIIPNDQKITAKLIFVNLTCLFNDYHQAEREKNYALNFANSEHLITISHRKEEVCAIAVTDFDIRIDSLKTDDALLRSLKKFIHSIVD